MVSRYISKRDLWSKDIFQTNPPCLRSHTTYLSDITVDVLYLSDLELRLKNVPNITRYLFCTNGAP